MRLFVKQRFFSFLDSFDVYDESKNVVFHVKGKLNFGHYLEVLDNKNIVVGHIEQELFHLLHPTFNIYIGNRYVGNIRKKFTLFTNEYDIQYNGYSVIGNFFELDYSIYDQYGQLKATVSKELLHFKDYYCLDIKNDNDVIDVLMFTLAIDCEKCSRSK